MSQLQPPPRSSSPTPSEPLAARTGAVLVLGEGGGLGAALLRRFEQSGSPAASALDLTEGPNWRGCCARATGVRSPSSPGDDAHALRLTLLSAHVRPDLPLRVTMFDHTVSRELEHVAPKVHVLSPSEIVAGDLAEAGEEIVVDDALRLLVAVGAAGIPVAVGRGDDREMLQRVGIEGGA